MKFKVGDVVRIKDSFFERSPAFAIVNYGDFRGRELRVVSPQPWVVLQSLDATCVDYKNSCWMSDCLELVRSKSRIRFIYT